ncbi:Translation elongation factor P Lys34:lysine transferase [hydrothermal vent metagenome]|uniref:Translation elongation factor P Lys34:lysine transferase n=1 Tax=hydrothermal vent metagenome TaxID=652676 RepID=A0A1W1DCX2_9ZZZZ
MREDLKKYSDFLQKIRHYFNNQSVLEVQTSALLNTPATDVYIDSLSMKLNQGIDLEQTRYLHTSPELEMKKLLANGSGDIYQICEVFRDNEQGSQNFNEFTMLEYYRLGFDIHQLMDDMVQLLKTLDVECRVSKLSYAQAFFEYGDIDILNTDFAALKVIAKAHSLSTDFEWIEDLQILLFTHLIEPKLKDLPLCFVYDYPAAQSALAIVEGKVAHRFELYINGVEVANGYDELRHANEYQVVFEQEIAKRRTLKKYTPDLNKGYLETIQSSLPQCAGVAIGMVRLFSEINLK